MYVATPGRAPRQEMNAALENFKVEGHVANLILPVIGVEEQDFQITKINVGDTLRRIRTKRAPLTQGARVSTPIDYTTGHCEERYAEEGVDVTVKSRVRNQFDTDKPATKTAATLIANDIEFDVFETLFNETNYPLSGTTGLDTANRWTDRINATPIDDVNTVLAFLEAQGTPGNAMVLNKTRARNLWVCDRVRDRMTQMYGRVIPGKPDPAILAEIFGLDEVIIAGAKYNTANPGATNAFDFIASGKYCGVFRKSMDTALVDPRLGNIFVWTNAYAASEADLAPVPDEMPQNIMEFARIESYDEPSISGHFMAVRTFTDEVLLQSTAFKLIKIADS